LLPPATYTTCRDTIERCAETLVMSVKSLVQFVDIKVAVLSSFAPNGLREDLCAIMERELGTIRAVVGKTLPAPDRRGKPGVQFQIHGPGSPVADPRQEADVRPADGAPCHPDYMDIAANLVTSIGIAIQTNERTYT
jgi:hypothetical protein